ncbi:MAG: polyprenol monophosphomannose synthase [Planctomycetales bacterium]|nr:polyprenol monophosphomannose synthase [Planctomycetales bacterium]
MPPDEPDPAATADESKTFPRVLVTVATYNELENLPLLTEQIFAQAPTASLLVVDDNSPDGTGRWADEKAASDKRLHVLHRSGKLGLGSATIAAMQYAIEHDYDYMLNLDADLSHPTSRIPALVEGMSGSADTGPLDVMIGSRYVPGGGASGWPWRRRMMSRGVNLYAQLLLGLRVNDCSGAFRCYRVATLRKLDFAKIRSMGYAFQEEVLWRLKQVGARFGEAPIVFTDRQYGSSKINGKEARDALWIIFRLGVKNYLGW